MGVLALFVGVLAFAGAGWNYAFSRVDKEARFEQSTTDSLRRIDETLKLIPAQIATSKYSDAPPKELRAHSDELRAIKTSLVSANQSAPNYWPISFQVINLLSLAESYIQNPKAGESTLDNVSGVNITNNGDVVVLEHNISNSTIENSVIRFDPTVRLQNVTFKNCVFIFPSGDANPAQPLKDIGNVLLRASDLSNVSVTAS